MIVIPVSARRWAWVIVVGLAVVVLVVVPFHVRIGGIKVKCGAPAIAVSVPEIPEQCLPPAVRRLAAAGAILALNLVIAALARRHTSRSTAERPAQSGRHRCIAREGP